MKLNSECGILAYPEEMRCYSYTEYFCWILSVIADRR